MKEMAPSICASLLLSLILAILLICPTSARLSVKADEGVLHDICSSHRDPPFCLKALKSDPRTITIDLVGLTNISIHLADVAANKTFAFIGSLVNKTSDPKLKPQYESCHQFYESLVGDIENAKDAWKGGDYFTVVVAADSCLTSTGDCRDEITTNASPLLRENKEVSYYCETLLLVSKCLSGLS